jgi:5-methylcytosine-specific restriction endonuclease McrA
MKAIHYEAICAKRSHPKRGDRRGVLTTKVRKEIWKKTGGTCHVCGGRAGRRWQADHIVPYQLGGSRDPDNYLPVCMECNRLRWSHEPKVIRLILRMGVYAKNAIRRGGPLGDLMLKALQVRHGANRRRRSKKAA